MDPRARRESGQAAVESALTLPLTLFLILGTLQLFMMLHGRIMAEYAVFRATRAGSVNQGDCRVMTHAALGALLPIIARTDSPTTLGRAFLLHGRNLYSPIDRWGDSRTRVGAIVWIVKQLDRQLQGPIQETFDDRSRRGDVRAEIQVDMVFWFPLKIPFADWVMSRAYLAMFGALPYISTNPLMPTQRATWTKDSSFLDGTNTLTEMRSRILRRQYDFPIRTSFRMRMMTPAIQINQTCPRSPTSL